MDSAIPPTPSSEELLLLWLLLLLLPPLAVKKPLLALEFWLFGGVHRTAAEEGPAATTD